MFEDSIKIHLIEEVLKLDDRTTLKELESVIKRAKSKKGRGSNTAKQRFLKELKHSVKEVGLAKAGKLKLQSAKSFLNEL
jgi:hypothetical protein